MYDIDRPKSIFISFLEDFLTEAERTVYFFFAFVVFVFTFLLTLFGRDGFYTGIVGVLCLLLLKARDIVNGFSEMRQSHFEPHKIAQESKENMQEMYSAFNESAVLLVARNFNNKFDLNVVKKPEENSLLEYLKSCQKIIEASELFFPGKPLNIETQKALYKMSEKAKDYFINLLTQKYSFSNQVTESLRLACTMEKIDTAQVALILKENGIDEPIRNLSVKILQTLSWIEEKTKNIAQEKPSDVSQNAQTPPLPS